MIEEKALTKIEYSPLIRRAIPETYFNELLYWRDNFDRGAWRVGDIANELYALSIANRLDIDKWRIHDIVAQVVGKSSRSVRSYATVAAFYPESIRLEYGVLPFSHFAYAMSLKNETGTPMFQGVLETSYEYMMSHGVPPSVDRLGELVFCRKDHGSSLVESGTVFPVPILEANLAPMPVLNQEPTQPHPNGFVACLERASYHIQALTGLLESALRSESALTGNAQAAFKVAKALALLNDAKEDIVNTVRMGYNTGASVSLPSPGIPAPHSSDAGQVILNQRG